MRFSEALIAAREAAGMSQVELAEAIEVSQGTVSKWERGEKMPRFDRLARIANALSAPHLTLALSTNMGLTPVMGHVGAGQQVIRERIEGLETIEAPPTAPEGAEAVIVRGSSMLPLLRDRQVLVFWRKEANPVQFIGELCVVETADERMYVKTLRRGIAPNLWTLESLNAEPLENVKIAWAAPVEVILRRPNWSDE